jgi:hypothetical protein
MREGATQQHVERTVTDSKTTQGAGKSADDLKDKASSLASAVVEEAKMEGQRAVNRIRDEAERLGEDQKDDVASRIGDVAGTLRGASDDLRTKDERAAANVTEAAADHLQRFSETLSSKDLRSLVDDASDLARRYPAVFLGGAVMLGFMAARFAKSSQHDDADVHAGSTGQLSG